MLPSDPTLREQLLSVLRKSESIELDPANANKVVMRIAGSNQRVGITGEMASFLIQEADRMRIPFTSPTVDVTESRERPVDTSMVWSLAEFVLERFLPQDTAGDVLGDLHEHAETRIGPKWGATVCAAWIIGAALAEATYSFLTVRRSRRSMNRALIADHLTTLVRVHRTTLVASAWFCWVALGVLLLYAYATGTPII